MREELSTRLNSNETMEIIREKEDQIRGLLEEGELYSRMKSVIGVSHTPGCQRLLPLLLGEKLSKQQLQHCNIIKKLRVKEKEIEAKITHQNKKLKEQEEELKHLQQVSVFFHCSLLPSLSDR